MKNIFIIIAVLGTAIIFTGCKTKKKLISISSSALRTDSLSTTDEQFKHKRDTVLITKYKNDTILRIQVDTNLLKSLNATQKSQNEESNELKNLIKKIQISQDEQRAEAEELAKGFDKDIAERFGKYDTASCVQSIRGEYQSSLAKVNKNGDILAAIKESQNSIENSLRKVDRDFQDLLNLQQEIMDGDNQDIKGFSERVNVLHSQQDLIKEKLHEEGLKISEVSFGSDMLAKQISDQKLTYDMISHNAYSFSFESGRFKLQDIQPVSSAAVRDVLEKINIVSEKYQSTIESHGLRLRLIILCFGFADEEGQKDDLVQELQLSNPERLNGKTGSALLKAINEIISERRATTCGSYIMDILYRNNISLGEVCWYGYGTKYPNKNIKYVSGRADSKRRIVQAFFHLVAYRR